VAVWVPMSWARRAVTGLACVLAAACAPASARVATPAGGDPAPSAPTAPTVLAGHPEHAEHAGAVAGRVAGPGGGLRRGSATAGVRDAVRTWSATAGRVGPRGPGAPAGTAPAWWIDASSSGRPFPGAVVDGLLTFRGNPTRSWTGAGPVPDPPVLQWRHPATGGMCSQSSDGNETSTWCGTGWTGQPVLWWWEGRLVTAFGAYDGAVHVLDALTGAPLFDPFPTGDLIKGSVSVDPTGAPLLYVGSRDGYLRVIAFDRPQLTELWRLSATAVEPTLWNDDWDGSPLVLGDLLIEGGENSQLHVVRLHKGVGSDGLVTVDPELVFHAPGWDDTLLAELGSTNVSIENSVATAGGTLYFANSGGLVQGWDLAALLEPGAGPAARTFRFWMGDDVDASVVIDEAGDLYVAAEYERALPRAAEVGQLVKLDPDRPGDPLVWSVPLRSGGVPSGVWATPALHRDLVIVATHAGELLGVDRVTGAIRWTVQLVGPTWGSPVVVDDVLVQGDCSGVLRGFDVSDTTAAPRLRWSVSLGGCLESTPAVFGGRVVVGSRSGQVFGLGAG
jgi:hypothetical protein